MGLFPSQRYPRATTTIPAAHEALPVSKASSSTSKRKWTNFIHLIALFVVIAEIVFLGRLDFVVNALDTLYGSLGSHSNSHELAANVKRENFDIRTHPNFSDFAICVDWLERKDAVTYSRNFNKFPIRIYGGEREWISCDVGCVFGVNHSVKPDAGFGLPQPRGRAAILRSMESSRYYDVNNINIARRRGYSIVMTTSLSSDVPVGYFSWAEYDLMAPVQPKTENALAAAFISNCAARNFRMQALEALNRTGIKIDSYGICHRNRHGRVNKLETLKRYKFSLAFENSIEEDYVTEKFFQSLVAGTVPVVVGAPNIQDFAPSPDSVLHIKKLGDVESVAKTMNYLAENPDAYNKSLRWKYEGPSDSFKALVDMAAVHSSCRLCIHMATVMQEKEEKRPNFKKRPCKCTRGSETVYHIFVRERGKFEMDSVFLRSEDLTLKGLETAVLMKFQTMRPIWKQDRPKSLRGGGDLKVYRIYPLGLTQRQALYTFSFNGDADLRRHIESNPCAKFEVIFV